MTEPLLHIDDITVHYSRLAAIRGVSISVNEGEIVCVVGPNGAGKSTTLLTVSGILNPTSGNVMLAGNRINGMRPENVARLGISQVPEGRHVFTALTVEENLRVGAAMRKDKAQVNKDVKWVMDLFPILAERSHQYEQTLNFSFG